MAVGSANSMLPEIGSGASHREKVLLITSTTHVLVRRSSSFDGYVLAGSTPSAENGDNKLWIYAIDTSGRLQWEKIYSQPESDDVARAIVATEDGYPHCRTDYLQRRSFFLDNET